MSKKILSILCLIFMGLCCILAGIIFSGNFDFSKQKPFNKTFRTQVNKEWEDHVIQKEFDIKEVKNLELENILTAADLYTHSTIEKIIIKVKGLPENAIDINLKDKTLKINEKDIWNITSSGNDDRDKFIISNIEMLIPEKFIFNLMLIKNKKDIKCEDIKADNLKIRGDFGNVDIEKCRFKEANIESNTNINFISAITESFSIKSKYGNIKIGLEDSPKIKQSFVSSEYGNIEIEDMQTIDFNGESGYGSFDITKSNFENIKIKSGGNFKLKGKVKNTLNVSCEYGNIDIDLEESNSIQNCVLETEYGNITGKNFKTEVFTADLEYGNFLTLNCEYNNAKIDCGGNIQIDGKLGGHSSFVSHRGNININLESDINNYDISASTGTQGNIRVNNLKTISKYSAKAKSENSYKITARSDLGNINITGSVE
ncbi:DUF4097 family beta strand repeat-containing protein [Treponema putidum]|uniref:DUF4097 family beta strand repeat-containing protein n=1 Tax=Treponema putidum TaxID=221027 RepID=UPI003D8A1176